MNSGFQAIAKPTSRLVENRLPMCALVHGRFREVRHNIARRELASPKSRAKPKLLLAIFAVSFVRLRGSAAWSS